MRKLLLTLLLTITAFASTAQARPSLPDAIIKKFDKPSDYTFVCNDKIVAMIYNMSNNSKIPPMQRFVEVATNEEVLNCQSECKYGCVETCTREREDLCSYVKDAHVMIPNPAIKNVPKEANHKMDK